MIQPTPEQPRSNRASRRAAQLEARRLQRETGRPYAQCLREVTERTMNTEARRWLDYFEAASMRDTHIRLARRWVLPTAEELTEIETLPEEEQRHRRTKVDCLAFEFTGDKTYDDVQGIAEQIKASSGAAVAAVAPIGEIGPDGNEILGTVSDIGFRVFSIPAGETVPELPNVRGDWAAQVVIRARVIDPISRMDGVGLAVLKQFHMVTTPHSPQQILAVRMIMRDKPIMNVMERVLDIADLVGVEWVRAMQDGDNARAVVMYLGDAPIAGETIFARPLAKEWPVIEDLELWGRKLAGPSIMDAPSATVSHSPRR